MWTTDFFSQNLVKSLCIKRTDISGGRSQRELPQGFPQGKIIAGSFCFIAGHMAISGLISSVF